jgi:hypothetical protein
VARDAFWHRRTVRQDLLPELLQGNARLEARDAGAGIPLEEAVHPMQVQRDSTAVQGGVVVALARPAQATLRPASLANLKTYYNCLLSIFPVLDLGKESLNSSCRGILKLASLSLQKEGRHEPES